MLIQKPKSNAELLTLVFGVILGFFLVKKLIKYFDMYNDEYLKHLQKYEGGKSKNPNDSASKHYPPEPYKDGHFYHTNKGVTWSTFKSLIGNDSQRFYKMSDKDFDKCIGYYYLDGVIGKAKYVFHAFAWGSGKDGTKKWLKAFYGVTTSKELAEKLNKQSDAKLKSLVLYRLDRLKSLSTWQYFGKGWTNRTNSLIKVLNLG